MCTLLPGVFSSAAGALSIFDLPTEFNEYFGSCFSSPMLATLLSKFRDDCLDALGLELPPRLPLRVRRQKLEVPRRSS
jgi:hypothetical protein